MKTILKITGLVLLLTACQHQMGKPLTHEQICHQISQQLNLNQMSNEPGQTTQRAELLSQYQSNQCGPIAAATQTR